MSEQNKPHTFVLKEDGKIYYVSDVPELIQTNAFSNDYREKAFNEMQQRKYNNALQSAIANGIEVENQDEVKREILNIYEPEKCTLSWCEGKSKIPGTDGCYNQCAKYKNIEEGKLYPLQCRVEIFPSDKGPVARVTFPEDKPEKSRMPEFNSPRNWKEDYPHENGNYVCTCSICKEQFYGHKRRVVCKVCAEPEAAGLNEQPEKKSYYEKCDKKCEGYPNSDCNCSYGDFEQPQEELWREAESIVSASLGTYKTSLSDKMAKWAIDELKKQFTLTRKK